MTVSMVCVGRRRACVSMCLGCFCCWGQGSLAGRCWWMVDEEYNLTVASWNQPYGICSVYPCQCGAWEGPTHTHKRGAWEGPTHTHKHRFGHVLG